MSHPPIFPPPSLLVSYLPIFILYPLLLFLRILFFYSLQGLKILVSKLFGGLGYLCLIFLELIS